MSETGVINVDDSEVLTKGRLGPGNMILVDLETGKFSQNVEVKRELARQAPYGEWLKKHRCAAPQSMDAPMVGLIMRGQRFHHLHGLLLQISH